MDTTSRGIYALYVRDHVDPFDSLPGTGEWIERFAHARTHVFKHK